MNLLLRGRLEIVTRPGALFSPFLDSLRSPASLGKRVRTGEAPLQRFPCCRREWRGTGLSVQLSAIGDYLLMQNRYRDTKNSHDISQRGSISSPPPPTRADVCLFAPEDPRLRIDDCYFDSSRSCDCSDCSSLAFPRRAAPLTNDASSAYRARCWTQPRPVLPVAATLLPSSWFCWRTSRFPIREEQSAGFRSRFASFFPA